MSETGVADGAEREREREKEGEIRERAAAAGYAGGRGAPEGWMGRGRGGSDV